MCYICYSFRYSSTPENLGSMVDPQKQSVVWYRKISTVGLIYASLGGDSRSSWAYISSGNSS